mmetsp:Transcript_23374/g.55594  ORF Transcript_23374/g.55594 Transcript_23374/m.55594 type:complete len:232 (-) Transcript_23374:4076-4771(-)
MDRAVLQLHLDHVAAGRFHGLLHRDRHFLGLALAHADAAIAITDDGQRCEGQRAATLHDLGHAVHRDHLFLQAVVIAFGLRAGLKLCHFVFLDASELQTGFAGGFGQRLDAAVVGEARAVERDLLDASCLGLLGDQLADQRGRSDVATVADLLAHRFLGGRGSGQHLVAVFRQDLGVDVKVGAEHRQTGHTLQGDASAGLARTTQALFFLGHHGAAPYFFLVSLRETFSSA